MIISNHIYNKGQIGNLVFLDLNIISNLSDPSNHSQTLTNFTLNPPSLTFNPLKVTTQTSHSNPPSLTFIEFFNTLFYKYFFNTLFYFHSYILNFFLQQIRLL